MLTDAQRAVLTDAEQLWVHEIESAPSYDVDSTLVLTLLAALANERMDLRDANAERETMRVALMAREQRAAALEAENARLREGRRRAARGHANDKVEAEVTRLRTSLEGWKKLYTECDTTRDALIEQYAETAYQNALRWAAGEIRTFARDCDIDEREVHRLAGRIEAGPEPVKETTDETD